MFIGDAPTDIAVLSEAVTGADLPEVARAAHRLKSGCGAVGATRLGRLAEQIEAAALGGPARRRAL